MKYTIDIVTRVCEGASWEDIQNGDGYEIAYLVKDENGEVVMDTTDRNIAIKYLEE